MRIKIISYGYKFYEEQGLEAPEHDFLFSLRDLNNPYWIPELKPFCGLDSDIVVFFEKDPVIQDRLSKITTLIEDFIRDFLANDKRPPNLSPKLTFAFRCTGGKHRSVYFADIAYKKIREAFADNPKLSLDVEHVDLPRYYDPASLEPMLKLVHENLSEKLPSARLANSEKGEHNNADGTSRIGSKAS